MRCAVLHGLNCGNITEVESQTGRVFLSPVCQFVSGSVFVYYFFLLSVHNVFGGVQSACCQKQILGLAMTQPNEVTVH